MLVLPGRGQLRFVFFVTQQRIDAMRLLRNKIRCRSGAWGERRAVDDPKDSAFAIDERVLSLRRFVIYANLVFLSLLPKHIAHFVLLIFYALALRLPR